MTTENDPVEVPPVREKATSAPPEFSEFPAESLASRDTVIFDPEETVLEETVTRDWAKERAPGVTVIFGFGVDVIGDPLIEALIVDAVPEA